MESQPTEEVPVPIPGPLKTHMEDDCFWILRRERLLILPRKPNVEDILRQFYSHCVATASEETNLPLLVEVLDGIKVYFDFCVEDHLLYAPEREQFKKVMEKQRNHRGKVTGCKLLATHSHEDNSKCTLTSAVNTDTNAVETNSHLGPTPPISWQPIMPSQVYGAEHLLRLFLKFPFLLSRAQLPPSHIQLLQHHFKELLSFFCSQRVGWFSEDNYDDIVPLLAMAATIGPSTQPDPEKGQSTENAA